MKNLPDLPKSYFEGFRGKKVNVKPFDPKSKIIAQKYVKRLMHLLKGYDVQILHRGSTAFGIAGKGDIEIGIYPKRKDWQSVIDDLKLKFGEPGNIEENYARFNEEDEGYEIEIILQKGYAAKLDIAFTDYMLGHTKLLKEYENIKMKYSYSKMEYEIQKNKFIRKVKSRI